MLKISTFSKSILSKTHRKEDPRALGALQFNAVEKMLRKSWFNVMKGARKVGFMIDLLLEQNEKIYFLQKYAHRFTDHF